jgi:dihydropteroate synthase
MISDGATFIDIGAYSSKPSAEFVSENEGRIVPVVQLILKHFPEALLHSTFRSERSGIENGAANHDAMRSSDIKLLWQAYGVWLPDRMQVVVRYQ